MTRPEFNDLILKISRKLYGYSFHMLGNQEEAEDAVQEVFMKLWKMNAELDHFNSTEALAMKMTRNYCIDLLRRTKRIIERNLNACNAFYHEVSSPYEQLENKETYAVILNIINRMPGNYSELIFLRDIEGFTYEEISVITGQTINSLRVNLSRARKLLKEQFKRYYNE